MVASCPGVSVRDPVPNVDVRLYKLAGGDRFTAVIYALQDIKAAEPLLLDWQNFASSLADLSASLVCNCGGSCCRGRLASRAPCNELFSSYRFPPVPGNALTEKDKEKWQARTFTPITVDGRQFGTCIQFPGLPRPVHPGDWVLLPALQGSLLRPAQVLSFVHKPASAHLFPIAYRIGVFATSPLCKGNWTAPARKLFMTTHVEVYNGTVKAHFPLALLNCVAEDRCDVCFSQFRKFRLLMPCRRTPPHWTCSLGGGLFDLAMITSVSPTNLVSWTQFQGKAPIRFFGFVLLQPRASYVSHPPPERATGTVTYAGRRTAIQGHE